MKKLRIPLHRLTRGCGYPDDAEKLERLLRWPSLQSRWQGVTVRIWSGEHRAWWRHPSGYTREDSEAAYYAFEGALAKTRHCGPEKAIDFLRVRTQA